MESRPPKRPMNAYFKLRIEQLPLLKEEFPEEKAKEIQQRISKMYKDRSNSEVKKDKAMYDKSLAKWRKSVAKWEKDHPS